MKATVIEMFGDNETSFLRVLPHIRTSKLCAVLCECASKCCNTFSLLSMKSGLSTTHFWPTLFLFMMGYCLFWQPLDFSWWCVCMMMCEPMAGLLAVSSSLWQIFCTERHVSCCFIPPLSWALLISTILLFTTLIDDGFSWRSQALEKATGLWFSDNIWCDVYFIGQEDL